MYDLHTCIYTILLTSYILSMCNNVATSLSHQVAEDNHHVDIFMADQNQPKDDPGYGAYTLTTDHCNHHNNIAGQEGLIFPGYTLRQVHIVLSPGHTDISSSVEGEGLRFQPASCVFRADPNSSDKINSFRESAIIYKTVQQDRHGFKELHPTFDDQCHNNHVTTAGIKQLISLGEHIHHSYLSKPSHKRFVPHSSHIHVESIASKSTYQSILPFLHGLLPEKEFAKTKINKILSNFCAADKIHLSNCHCSKTAELIPYVSQALTKGRYLYKNVIPFEKELLELFGRNRVGDFSSVELFEMSKLSKCNNVTLICDNKDACYNFTSEEDTILGEVSSNFLQYLRTSPTFKYFSELNSYPFLQRLVQNSINLDWSQNLEIHMGDKQYLETLMTSLGIKRRGVMPPASRLVFEIFQKNPHQIDGGKIYMRVLYNGLDVTEAVTGCHSNMENDLCPMDRFIDQVNVLQKQYLSGCPVSK